MMKVEIDRGSGFCGGVIRAIAGAEKALAEGGSLLSLGDIVHNEAELARLSNLGLHSITLDQLRLVGGEGSPFGSSPYGLTPPSDETDGPPATEPRVLRPSRGDPQPLGSTVAPRNDSTTTFWEEVETK